MNQTTITVKLVDIILFVLEIGSIIYLVYSIYTLQKKVKDIAENSCYSARKRINDTPEIRGVKIESPEDFFKTLFSNDNSEETTLEEQLREALNENEFEKAAELRIKIEERDQKNGKK